MPVREMGEFADFVFETSQPLTGGHWRVRPEEGEGCKVESVALCGFLYDALTDQGSPESFGMIVPRLFR